MALAAVLTLHGAALAVVQRTRVTQAPLVPQVALLLDLTPAALPAPLEPPHAASAPSPPEPAPAEPTRPAPASSEASPPELLPSEPSPPESTPPEPTPPKPPSLLDVPEPLPVPPPKPLPALAKPEVALPPPRPPKSRMAPPHTAPRDPRPAVIAPTPPPSPTASPNPAASPSPAVASPAHAGQEAATWASKLAAHLLRFRHYPPEAERRRFTGEALVRFSLDGAGRIVSAILVRSAGHDVLDQEALAWLQRAQPLPQPPPDKLAPAQITVPLSFVLR